MNEHNNMASPFNSFPSPNFVTPFGSTIGNANTRFPNIPIPNGPQYQIGNQNALRLTSTDGTTAGETREMYVQCCPTIAMQTDEEKVKREIPPGHLTFVNNGGHEKKRREPGFSSKFAPEADVRPLFSWNGWFTQPAQQKAAYEEIVSLGLNFDFSGITMSTGTITSVCLARFGTSVMCIWPDAAPNMALYIYLQVLRLKDGLHNYVLQFVPYAGDNECFLPECRNPDSVKFADLNDVTKVVLQQFRIGKMISRRNAHVGTTPLTGSEYPLTVDPRERDIDRENAKNYVDVSCDICVTPTFVA